MDLILSANVRGHFGCRYLVDHQDFADTTGRDYHGKRFHMFVVNPEYNE